MQNGKKLNNNFRALIPAIPFIRNLIEFKDGNKIKGYLTLTYVLHQKNEEKMDEEGDILSKKTNDILISDLEDIFSDVIKDVDFKYSEEDKDKTVVGVIFAEANTILADKSIVSVDIGNKIILAIAIRLKSEEFMIKKINNSVFVNGITKSQTGMLFGKIKKDNLCNENELKVLESVNIMTPENIHLNSFMYEPILDMDIVELKELYKKVRDNLI